MSVRTCSRLLGGKDRIDDEDTMSDCLADLAGFSRVNELSAAGYRDTDPVSVQRELAYEFVRTANTEELGELADFAYHALVEGYWTGYADEPDPELEDVSAYSGPKWREFAAAFVASRSAPGRRRRELLPELLRQASVDLVNELAIMRDWCPCDEGPEPRFAATLICSVCGERYPRRIDRVRCEQEHEFTSSVELEDHEGAYAEFVEALMDRGE